MDPENKGFFTCESIENVIKERGADQESIDDIIDALKAFDKDNDGKITVEDFKNAMMTTGEGMREKDID